MSDTETNDAHTCIAQLKSLRKRLNELKEQFLFAVEKSKYAFTVSANVDKESDRLHKQYDGVMPFVGSTGDFELTKHADNAFDALDNLEGAIADLTDAAGNWSDKEADVESAMADMETRLTTASECIAVSDYPTAVDELESVECDMDDVEFDDQSDTLSTAKTYATGCLSAAIHSMKVLMREVDRAKNAAIVDDSDDDRIIEKKKRGVPDEVTGTGKKQRIE